MHLKRSCVLAVTHKPSMVIEESAKLEKDRSDTSVLIAGRYLTVVGLEHLFVARRSADVA